MKALNFIDLAFQTLILGAVVILSLIVAVMGQLETVGMFAMYGGMLLGPWQLVSSLSTCLAKAHYLKLRVIHLVSSIVYLVVISLVAAFLSHTELNTVVEIVGIVLGFGIPVVLAGFYYYITIKSFQLARVSARS